METVLVSLLHSFSAGAAAPEWVHLVPAGTFSGEDGRGPYELGDAEALIARSLQAGRKLPIDVNHAIDLAGQLGQASPAVGWIVALEARADGVWGKVEWTPQGERLFAERAYGFLSPVFTAAKAAPHRLHQILRASLTNDPNLTSLTALHHRTGGPSMDEDMRKALGLPETATQAEILAAVTRSLNAASALATIATAAGLAEGATSEEIVTALQSRGGGDGEVAELRGQVRELNARLTTAVTEAATVRATTFVDRAIEEGKLVPALRDRYIARHIKEPADVEAEVKLMPSLHAGGLGHRRQIEIEDGDNLAGADAEVVEMMGLDPKAYAAQAKAMSKEVL